MNFDRKSMESEFYRDVDDEQADGVKTGCCLPAIVN
jgi:hypothetical protein